MSQTNNFTHTVTKPNEEPCNSGYKVTVSGKLKSLGGKEFYKSCKLRWLGHTVQWLEIKFYFLWLLSIFNAQT